MAELAPTVYYGDLKKESSHSISDLYDFGFTRLLLLAALEFLPLSPSKESLNDLLKKFEFKFPRSSHPALDWKQSSTLDPDSDAISHQLLRLVFAHLSSHSATHFFVKNEKRLFTTRMKNTGLEKLDVLSLFQQLFSKYGTLEFASAAEIKSLNNLEFDNETTVLKLPFEYALPLVESRSVFLKNGIAYIRYPSQMPEILAFNFSNNLEHQITQLTKIIPTILSEEDGRLKILILELCKTVTQIINMTTSDISQSTGSNSLPPITVSSIVRLSTYFPPCIHKLHESTKSKHLKFVSRNHYILFLKSIGTELSSMLQIFRMACNDLNDDEYTKSSYDYRIRWLYGQEGRRVEMHMPSCQAMLTSPQEQPTAGDRIAGCLFAKRFSSEFRQESIGAIAKRNVGNSILMDIEDLVQRDRPQAACALLFKGVYNRSCGGDVMKNPVEWYVMAASKNI